MGTTEISAGEAEQGSEQLLSVLEPDQLTGVKRKLPRRQLNASELIVLWSLRLYLLFMIVVVIYQTLTAAQ